MARMPYRHADPGAPHGDRLTRLREALTGGDTNEAAGIALRIGATLAADPSTDADPAAALEHVVRAVADNRRALLPHRPLIRDLGRTVKDPWRIGPVEPNPPALVAAMEPSEVVSVRLDPDIDLSSTANGPLGRPAHRPGAITFKRGHRETATLAGPVERMELLMDLLPSDGKLLPSDVEAQLLPRDLGAFAKRMSDEHAAVERLLAAGRTLVEAAERLVCRLYGLPSDLEEAVVAHAVARAALSQAPAEPRLP